MKTRLSLLNPGWLLATVLAVLLPLAAKAQVTPDWTSSQSGANGSMVAADAANNAWVAGTATATTSMQLKKVSPAGATLLQRSFGSATSPARSTSVAVDAGGNVVATGYLHNSAGQPQGAVVLKFDTAGNLLWQDAMATAGSLAYKALTDTAGNVYVLGHRLAPNGTGGLAPDITVTRYSPQGSIQWVRSWGANSVSGPEGMALTPAGQVLAAGRSSATGEAQVVFLDSAGNTLSTSHLATVVDPAVAVSSTGESAVVGAVGLDFMVMKFNAAFGPAWWRTFPLRGAAQRVAFDTDGNVVVSGVSNASTGTSIVYTWLTLKLDTQGNPLWTHSVGSGSFGSSGTQPFALALGPDNAAYITGQSRVTLASGVQATSTATVKLTAAGIQAWSANTADTTQGVSTRITSDGGVLVLGDTPVNLLTNAPASSVLYRYAQSGQPNQPPVAMVSASTTAGPAPLTVQFSSTGSSDPDGQIAGYVWDFGDGQTSSAASPSHVYASGSYTARLTVTDTLGAAATAAPIVITSNAVAAPAKPTSIVLGSTVVRGGMSTTGKVTVSSAAGVTVLLSSSKTSVARVPATVVVPAGATSATFTVTTSKVSRNTTVTLSAKANGAIASTVLTVQR